MHLQEILDRLLDAGRREAFADISCLPELCPHMAIIQLLDKHRNEIVPYAQNLDANDRAALTKSVAVLENQVGGRGSVTHVQRLLPLLSDPDRRILDWILRNTKSYSYYSHDATSIEELDFIKSGIAKRNAEKSERLKIELKEQQENRERKTRTATENLFNAVRRGDIKAVQSLVAKGADVKTLAPNGMTLIEFAVSLSRTAIAEELQVVLEKQNHPNPAVHTDAAR